MKFILSLFTTIVLFSLILFKSCSNLGGRPNKEDRIRFQNSLQYNPEQEVFHNRRPQLFSEMREKSMGWDILIEWFQKDENRTPQHKLPEIQPNLESFLKESNDLKVIWFGHSSFLLNLSGKIVLVDPVFSNAASPLSFMVKRFQAPVLQLHQLPEIDYILISHDHYDHLDMESIKYFIKKKTLFITPLGVGAHLKRWGLNSKRIIEKDWWESAKFPEIEFIATPSQHFSGRDGIHNNETLWASWVMKTNHQNIYFSGDSGYDTHFKDIGDKLGPFDLAFLESGQYDKRWKEVHLHPNQAPQVLKELKATKLFPIHWGMFELAFHPWNEPALLLGQLAQEHQFELITPKLGQVIHLNKETTFDHWWE